MLLTIAGSLESRVRQPATLLGDLAQTFPLFIIPATNHAPPLITTRIATVWDGHLVSITIPTSDDTIGRIIEQRATNELQSGLILREVYEDALARASSVIERGEDGDAAIRNCDEIYVRPVQKVRRPVSFTDQVCEAAQLRELRTEARMRRMRPGLPHVARAQHNQSGLMLAQCFVAESKPAHHAGAHVFNHDVRPCNQTISEFQSLWIFQAECDAKL